MDVRDMLRASQSAELQGDFPSAANWLRQAAESCRRSGLERRAEQLLRHAERLESRGSVPSAPKPPDSKPAVDASELFPAQARAAEKLAALARAGRRRLLLLGEAGSGKSTCLRSLAARLPEVGAPWKLVDGGAAPTGQPFVWALEGSEDPGPALALAQAGEVRSLVSPARLARVAPLFRNAQATTAPPAIDGAVWLEPFTRDELEALIERWGSAPNAPVPNREARRRMAERAEASTEGARELRALYSQLGPGPWEPHDG